MKIKNDKNNYDNTVSTNENEPVTKETKVSNAFDNPRYIVTCFFCNNTTFIKTWSPLFNKQIYIYAKCGNINRKLSHISYQ